MDLTACPCMYTYTHTYNTHVIILVTIRTAPNSVAHFLFSAGPKMKVWVWGADPGNDPLCPVLVLPPPATLPLSKGGP